MTQRTRIKICGLSQEADIEAAVEAGADALGFVLYERSPRYVTVERLAELTSRLPPFVTPVALVRQRARRSRSRSAIAAVPQLHAAVPWRRNAVAMQRRRQARTCAPPAWRPASIC